MNATARAIACAACLLLAPHPAAAQDQRDDFDFYVLALSWSPTFCATEEDAGDTEQCRAGAGHGFILHGLWPQYEQGYPEFCGGGDADDIRPALAASMQDLTPDIGLIRHTWRKHGTCTGLAPDDYFEAARAAVERVTIPAGLRKPEADRNISADAAEESFIAVNPGLAEDGIAISCASGWFREVRICLTRDLAFRDCEEVDRRGCRQSGLSLPAPDAP